MWSREIRKGLRDVLPRVKRVGEEERILYKWADGKGESKPIPRRKKSLLGIVL